MFKLPKIKLQILKHTAQDDDYPDIFTAKSVIPTWYKEAKLTLNDSPFTLNQTKTVKKCVPFLDAMVFGYMIPLPVDVVVSQVNGHIYFEWGNKEKHTPVEIRTNEGMQNMPIPNGYENIYPAWSTKTILDIPKGYSGLVTHPLNHFELPFLTTSGIVDSGIFYNGNIPFFIKEGFEGLIPAGTPIAQVIPFKRESWRSVKDLTLIPKARTLNNIRHNTAFAWYKNKVWVKKSFE
jgi:hypothetical protein